MDENSKTNKAPPPGRTPNTAREGQQEPETEIQIIPKKYILFNEADQGFLIEYSRDLLTKEDAQQLLQKLKEKGINISTGRMPLVIKDSISLFLEGVHGLEKQPRQIIDCTRLTSEQAYQQILEQLDKTNINSLKTVTMGVEQTVDERAVGVLAEKFTYHDIHKIPAGVNPKQLDFLREASNMGAFMRIKSKTASLITKYYTTDATYADLAKEHGVSQEAVIERVHTGMEKLYTVLHQKKPRLYHDNTYPLEQIKKGKDETKVFKTDKSRQRRREAHTRNPSLKQSTEPTDVYTADPSRPE